MATGPLRHRRSDERSIGPPPPIFLRHDHRPRPESGADGGGGIAGGKPGSEQVGGRLRSGPGQAIGHPGFERRDLAVGEPVAVWGHRHRLVANRGHQQARGRIARDNRRPRIPATEHVDEAVEPQPPLRCLVAMARLAVGGQEGADRRLEVIEGRAGVGGDRREPQGAGGDRRDDRQRGANGGGA